MWSQLEDEFQAAVSTWGPAGKERHSRPTYTYTDTHRVTHSETDRDTHVHRKTWTRTLTRTCAHAHTQAACYEHFSFVNIVMKNN